LTQKGHYKSNVIKIYKKQRRKLISRNGGDTKINQLNTPSLVLFQDQDQLVLFVADAHPGQVRRYRSGLAGAVALVVVVDRRTLHGTVRHVIVNYGQFGGRDVTGELLQPGNGYGEGVGAARQQ
jgi:hypothetical protein